jgi:pimeloyl-ACP methyl ester carboxylesterase
MPYDATTYPCEEMKPMTCQEWASATVPSLRFHLCGHGDAVVVLDSDDASCRDIWGLVTAELAMLTYILMIDRVKHTSGQALDFASEAPAIANEVDSVLQNLNNLRRVILVGWKRGSQTVQSLARERQLPIRGIVLIDPDPSVDTYAEDNCSVTAELLDGSPIYDAPTTVILPSANANTADHITRVRRNAQQAELKRIPHRREIIAGRSSVNIPIERPDVVVEAIQCYLASDD